MSMVPLMYLLLVTPLGPFTWQIVCLTAAAAAVGLLIPGPAAARRRLSVARSLPPWGAVLAARPDAWPLSRRLILALPAAAGLTLAVGSLVHRSGWWQAPVMALLTGVAVVALGRVESGQSRRERDRLIQDLPQCWELLSACLGAGLPLRAALAEVVAVVDGPVHAVLGEVLGRLQLGEDDAAAWRSIVDHPQLGPAATDLARSMESGIVVAGLLDEYAQQARDSRHARAQERAKAIGVAAVLPLMICFLPAFFLIGIVPIVAGALLPLLSGW